MRKNNQYTFVQSNKIEEGDAASLNLLLLKIKIKTMKKNLHRNFLIAGISILSFLNVKAQAVNATGNITTNTTGTKNNIYTLSPGFKYVTNNATLTNNVMITTTNGAAKTLKLAVRK